MISDYPKPETIRGPRKLADLKTSVALLGNELPHNKVDRTMTSTLAVRLGESTRLVIPDRYRGLSRHLARHRHWSRTVFLMPKEPGKYDLNGENNPFGEKFNHPWPTYSIHQFSGYQGAREILENITATLHWRPTSELMKDTLTARVLSILGPDARTPVSAVLLDNTPARGVSNHYQINTRLVEETCKHAQDSLNMSIDTLPIGRDIPPQDRQRNLDTLAMLTGKQPTQNDRSPGE